MGIASTSSQGAPAGGFSTTTATGSSSGPAAPASGTKYGGFGSEDIAKFGYNKSDQFGGGPYDPYTKTQSTTTGTTSKPESIVKKPQNKKAIDVDSDDESSDSDKSSIDSDDSDAQRKKKKRDERKAKKAAAAKAALEPAKTEEVKTEAPKPAPLGGLGQAPKAGRTFQGTQPAAPAQPAP